MLQLATKNKANIERALQDFLSLASMDQTGRDNVGAILGKYLFTFISGLFVYIYQLRLCNSRNVHSISIIETNS